MKLTKAKQMVTWLTTYATVAILLARVCYYFQQYISMILYDIMFGVALGAELMFIIMTVIYEGNDI